MKFSLLSILVAVLLLSDTFQQSFARRSYRTRYSRKKLKYQAADLEDEECKDVQGKNETCGKILRQLGLQVCVTKVTQLKAKMERSCQKSCNFCGAEKTDCRSSRYGCCWDGVTPREDVDGFRGCPECKDHLIVMCKRFRKKCTNNDFLKLHCPLTCERCTETVPKTKARITMKDWRQI